AQMDEAVRLVDALLQGETVSNDGPAYPMRDVAIGPRPVQQPRPPIWLGARRPGGIRRAGAWDGWIAVSVGDDGLSLSITPEALAEQVGIAREARRTAGLDGRPFDVAVFGNAGLDGFAPADFEAAGATWWLESVTPERGSVG